MADITITMKLFGAFRPFGESVEFMMPVGCSVADIKTRLAVTLKDADAALIHDSALANDNEIIGTETVFTTDADLAILPPVCGG